MGDLRGQGYSGLIKIKGALIFKLVVLTLDL